jgi:hypothetical protein
VVAPLDEALTAPDEQWHASQQPKVHLTMMTARRDHNMARFRTNARRAEADSFLLVELEYSDMLACETIAWRKQLCGGRMPRADPPRTEAGLRVVRTWIRDGAQRD